MSTCFGLPPGVHDVAPSSPDLFVEPVPSLWVDGLAHRPDGLDGGKVSGLNEGVPVLEQKTDGGGGTIELE